MMTSLNITNARLQIAQKMITTTDHIAGFEIKEVLGPVESIVEKEYRKSSVGGIGIVEGGGLSDMVFDAKQEIALSARDLGANAVVGLRYTLAGRDLEKSLLAYGTAVLAEKKG